MEEQDSGGSLLKANVYPQLLCVNYFTGPKLSRVYLRVIQCFHEILRLTIADMQNPKYPESLRWMEVGRCRKAKMISANFTIKLHSKLSPAPLQIYLFILLMVINGSHMFVEIMPTFNKFSLFWKLFSPECWVCDVPLAEILKCVGEFLIQSFWKRKIKLQLKSFGEADTKKLPAPDFVLSFSKNIWNLDEYVCRITLWINYSELRKMLFHCFTQQSWTGSSKLLPLWQRPISCWLHFNWLEFSERSPC